MLENQELLRNISIFLILFSIITIILFIVFVHTMPGKLARKRNNPQAEAIEILSLLGLLIFPLWMAALVWAYIKPFRLPVTIAGLDSPDTGQLPAATVTVQKQTENTTGTASELITTTDREG